MFDLLTYQKGGSVLRMLERYLGDEIFRNGIRIYLQRHAYANTVTVDLWQALEDASGEPVRALMDSWILQGGHPLVSIGQEGKHGKAELRQQPFAYTATPPLADEPSSIGTRWQVPVLVRSLDSEEAPSRFLLTEAEAAVEVDRGLSVLNAGGWGVYRSSYPGEHLAALGRRLDELEPLERALLFSDTWALVMSGTTGLDDFLTLAADLGSETEPTTWSVVAAALGLCYRVGTDDDRNAVAEATRQLLGLRLRQLTWSPQPGEDERTPSLRATLLRTVGVVGRDGEVRSEAAQRFDVALRDGGTPIDPDIEGAVLDVVTDQRRDGDYEVILEQYRNAQTPQHEQRYLFALASFPDTGLSARTFDLALSEVRTQNAPYLIGRLLAERVGGATAWERLKANWDDVLSRFPVNSHSRMLEGVSALCADAAVADDVTRFLTDHPLQVGPRHVTQTLERLAVNRAFAERYRGRLGRLMPDMPGSVQPA
jgi:puromycin-sensitive aminopeptidase